MKQITKNQKRKKNQKEVKPTNKQINFLCANLALLYLLQIADTVLTIWGVSIYGMAAEGNPIIKYLMVNYGILRGLLLVKVPALIFISILIIYATELYTKSLKNIVILLNIVYFVVSIMWLIVLI